MPSHAPHILCVNPWIHDFAAFDFWAKPLGLLQLAAIMREGGITVSYLDCLDRFHPCAVNEGRIKVQTDGRGPFRKEEIHLPSGLGLEDVGKRFSRYGIPPEWFRQDLNALKAANPPDLIFVTSLMTYWASGVRETIAVIKSIFPHTPVVLGGIYATLCTAHAKATSLADEVVPGRGEEQLCWIIKRYTGFSLAVNGVTNAHEKDEKDQKKGLILRKFKTNATSSPVISSQSKKRGGGVDLDLLPFPALDLTRRLTYLPILTSRGCPFSCDYCASSFLEPRLRHRSSERVFHEICHWRQHAGIQNIAFYDDALLMQPEQYFLPLLDRILSTPFAGDLAFHTPNALHIRQITKDVATMMYRAGFKTIRLGLESTDFSISRQADVKVQKHEFYEAVALLNEAGFTMDQIGAYLLCALPDQELDGVEHSIHLVKETGVTPVLAYYTPIPHTPMWEKAVAASRFDIEKDPLLTNNALLPCLKRKESMGRIEQLKQLCRIK